MITGPVNSRNLQTPGIGKQGRITQKAIPVSGSSSSQKAIAAQGNQELAIIKPEKSKVKYYNLDLIDQAKSDKLKAKLAQFAKTGHEDKDNSLPAMRDFSISPRYLAYDWSSVPEMYKNPIPNDASITMAALGDIALTSSLPEKAYLDFLSKVNVGPRAIIGVGNRALLKGLNASQDNMKKVLHPDSTWVPFYTTNRDKETGKIFSSHLYGNPDENITTKYYQKDSFKKICEESGIKTAPGEAFIKKGDGDVGHLQKLIDKYSEETGSVIIRPVAGLGGGGIVFIGNTDKDRGEKIKSVLDQSSNKFLVETAYDLAKGRPDVIYGAIADGKAHIYGPSSQIMKADKVSYHGNLMDFTKDIEDDMKEQALKISEHMIKNGYKGPFGIDFIRTTDDRLFPVECNARINGGMSAYETASTLSRTGRSFNYALCFKPHVHKSLNFEKLIKHPEIEKALYDGTKKPGIFPFDVNAIGNYGEFPVIAFAHSKDEAVELSESFRKNLENINTKFLSEVLSVK